MPFTFSAGSFPFLKSSTTSQPNIKQNNNVDNVNNINNNIVNDNLDMGKIPLNNTINVIPLERRVRSLDNSTPKNNRRTSNASNLKNTNNRRAWYKSLFVRIHQTLSRSNDDDIVNDDDNNNNNSNDHDCDVNNTVENNNDGSGVKAVTETENIGECDDDDPIIMKSRNVVAGAEKYSFICHGNTHDFYVVTKNGSMSNGSMSNGTMSNGPTMSNGSTNGGSLSNGPIPIDPLSNGPLSNGSLSNGPLNPSNSSPNSVFEECAKTPRHFAKEPEVLGKVGRFTIVRERADFDTTYFDKCHCQQKPCRFSSSGCGGTHPVLPPDDENDRPPIRRQQVTSISHHQSCSNKSDSKSRRSFYSNNTPSNSSRNSLPSLQQKFPVNVSCIPVSKATTPNVPSSNSSSISRVILPQSSSSPNLVHLNQRSKIENKNISKNLPNSSSIIVGGNSGKYLNITPTNNNGSYYPQCNNYSTAVIKKSKKPSLVNIKSTEEQQRRLSMPPTSTQPTQPLNLSSSSTPTTPTNPSKFSLYHHPNEPPHTTINSHSGRKFEVEWNTTAKSSSSSSTSSSSSSDTAYSPPSTISSVFSMASSPDKKSTINTLSRRCSTLSSKCGRKFEVTILSSSSSSNNYCILNTSPHSTIGSVNSIIVEAANTDSTKY
ncbi:unnamed protein product [Rhizophagus irregularis]|nr:unnamed protein product [Rhizophagus irregularis]CAB5367489.1 unnamed protein product [Rhizophagus irregularis]